MAVGDMKGVVMNEELENITIEASSATTPELAIEEIQSGKSLFKLFGSIYKALKGCVTNSKIVNNFTVTDASLNLVPNAATIKVLKDGQDAINTNLTQVNGTYVASNCTLTDADLYREGKKAFFTTRIDVTVEHTAGTYVQYCSFNIVPIKRTWFNVTGSGSGAVGMGYVDTNGLLKIYSPITIGVGANIIVNMDFRINYNYLN